MSFQQLFTESQGQPIKYKNKELKMVEFIHLDSKKVNLCIEFISTNSKWKQGIVLQTKGSFEVNGVLLTNKIILWEDTAPKKIEIIVNSKDKTLIIYNVWETEDGTTHYWHNGSAFFIEHTKNGNIFHCNDGYADEDFNDLIFKVEIK